MKSILSILLFISTTAMAQTATKPTEVFNATEIKFWIKQLNTNFKDIKLEKVGTADDYTIKSKRIPNSFENCYFYNAPKIDGYKMLKPSKQFKTKEQAIEFFNSLHKELLPCLKAEKFIFDEVYEDVYTYSKVYGTKGGLYNFVLDIDTLVEVVDGRPTNKVDGFNVRFEMKLTGASSYDEIEEPKVKAAPVAAVAPKFAFDCAEIKLLYKEAKSSFYNWAENQLAHEKYASKIIPKTFDSCVITYSIYTGSGKLEAYKNFETEKEAEIFVEGVEKQLKACLPPNSGKKAKNGGYIRFYTFARRRINLETYKEIDGFWVKLEIEAEAGSLVPSSK